MEDLAKLLLTLARKHGAEYADVRFERTEGSGLDYRDKELKEAVTSTDEGIGIRALFKGAWGFASTNDLTKDRLKDAVAKAVKIAKLCSLSVKEHEGLAPVKIEHATVNWKPKKDPMNMALEDKVQVLKDVDKAARTVKGINAVTVGYYDTKVVCGFFSTEGMALVHHTVFTSLQANIVAKGHGKVSSMRLRLGGTKGLEVLDEQDPYEGAIDMAKRVVTMLTAKKPPSGRLPLVADPDLTGVLVHEALGHACEADAILGGDSILEGQMGKTIASELVTIYDDPTVRGAFGSYPFDDEGVRTRRKVLVKKGVLNEFLHSRTTAQKLCMEPNGSARAESYSARPLVRMSNTFMGGGDHKFEELLEGIKLGVYAMGSRGGQVDTAKGTFQFNAQEAFLIEKGRITVPLRDLSLSGDTLRMLSDVVALANDSRVGDPGYCGKGQWVPVGDGGPHMRISQAVVGGS
jgi:TldD protein